MKSFATIVKQINNGHYRLHVVWDIDSTLDPRTSQKDIAEFFYKFCETFAERVSVGSYVAIKKQFYELQASSLLKQNALQAQIDDLMRYKHAYELGSGKK